MDKQNWPERVLFVDDEPNVLSGIKRQLRNSFIADTAVGGEAGLTEIEGRQGGGPYAVVISDMRMPKMNGVQFLKKVKAISPDTVRMVLTGFADQSVAIEAVNEGNIFRFLTKPCAPQVLSGALQAGIRQYRLITAERDLLEKTLKGSITVLTEILSLTDPDAFERATRLKTYVSKFASHHKLKNTWELESAAMLSPIGFVTLPKVLRNKFHKNESLSQKEQEMLEDVPVIGKRLINKIPRLESVAELVDYARIDPSIAPEEISSQIQVLKMLTHLIDLEQSGKNPAQALDEMSQDKATRYNRELLDKARDVFVIDDGKLGGHLTVLDLKLREILSGDMLREDILTEDKRLLLAAGATITPPILERLNNYRRLVGVQEPVKVARNLYE